MNEKLAPNECPDCGRIEEGECQFCKRYNQIMSIPRDAEFCPIDMEMSPDAESVIDR